ncbi:hypothetical protein D9756_005064 [Leucocoprinus leucothites]|uniref:Association with the SNF1 complex (ASC) domain-containing protein n=1 Tax=Leucocoprinus leucothites TaxID=201217 RepID=A0A8H5G973_9AGAR|nr:hypothetical protein D9756_005064 [Leucoagaricus leucothites]
MGNNASQQRRTDPNVHLNESPTRRGRSPSPIPTPGHPHPSMRTKKRSLELPDFNRGSAITGGTANGSSGALGSRARQKTPPKSQAINIPKVADDTFTKRPDNNFSSSELIIPATHLPFPPTQAQQRNASATYAGPGAVRGQRSRAGRPPRMSQVHEVEPPTPPHQQYQHYQQEPATPPSPNPFNREVVKSTIPIGLLTDADARLFEEEENEETPILQQDADIDDSTLLEPTPVQITWRGGGKVVVLARAGDDDWNGRQPMEREDPNTNVWTATIHLLPGTHHVRFLVDDQWRVSDELPTAVDDSGSLANYVSVQPGTPPSTATTLPPAPPSPTPAAPPQQAPTPPRQPAPGHSFWSTTSSVDDEDTNKPSTHSLHVQIASAKWTSVPPEPLIEAAREEEVYLQASAGHYDSQSRSTHVSGFVPAPNIPPAPGMPRHLDKLILNTKMTVPGSSSNGGNNGGGSGQGSPSRVGSGQASGRDTRERDRERERDRSRREGRERKRESRREEKREREQRKEREREQQFQQREQQQKHQATSAAGLPPNSSYANFPPAPPPSEDGSGAGLDEKPEQSPVRGDTATATGATADEAEVAQGESGNTTGITTPEPASTTPEGATTSTTSTSTTAPTPGTATTTTTTTTTTANPVPTVAITTPTSSTNRPPPTTATATPAASGSNTGMTVSGSRAITLDMENMPPLTDDNSVLPVPSHVVLQHLCTSAIRNGVLAVASTTRYRKKYMTTVYYKPTS